MPRDSWVGVHKCQQSVANPFLPHLTQPVMLRNIKISPKIANFVLLKLDFII